MKAEKDKGGQEIRKGTSWGSVAVLWICPEHTGNRWAAEITMGAMRRDRRALIRK